MELTAPLTIYHVESHCIICQACVDEAPENFAIDNHLQRAYVKNKPQNSLQEKHCRTAQEICPVEAIIST